MTSRAPLPLSGVIPPMITPLTPRGEIDDDGIGRLATHLVAAGIGGIFVLGSSGEGPWLTATQAERVIAATVGAVAGRVPVLAGILEPSTARALEAAATAEAAGADALVVTSPYYFVVDAAVQRHHVATIASATTLPLILYNIPQLTHNPMAPETVQRLLEIETVAGIKDSAGDRPGFARLLAARSARPGFRVFQGAERSSADAVLAGADGLVPGLGNLAPRLFVEMIEAGRNGGQMATRALQSRVDALWRLHEHGPWLACLKYAASLLGFGCGAVAGNAAGLSPAAQSAIRRLLEEEVIAAGNGDAATGNNASSLAEDVLIGRSRRP